MFKSLARFLGFTALALVVISAVLDLTRSIADREIVLTSLGKHWSDLNTQSLTLAQSAVQRYIHPNVWDPYLQWILLQPAWAVFLVLAILFLWLGKSRDRRWRKRFGN